MTSLFKIVHFVPDPFSGGRWPVAALVQRDNGVVQLVHAERELDAHCLGGALELAVYEMALGSLGHLKRFDEIPREIGLNVELGDPAAIPEGVDDPAKWVEEHILPRAAPEDPEPKRRPARRTRLAMRFLSLYGVSDLVYPRFTPARHLGTMLGSDAAKLQNVSQWVRGSHGQHLLLEPLAASRESAVDDAKDVWRNFSAYDREFSRVAGNGRPTLMAYVVGSGEEAERQRVVRAATDETSSNGWDVLDTEKPLERDLLLSAIRKTAASYMGDLGGR